ncbi:MAG: ribonuclease PH [Thermoguttaceae bacterium]|nr:ribonuclease PH [Thermoguttaceae bacterium]
MTVRSDGRAPDALRQIKVERNFIGAAPGSVLISAGGTTVLCTASLVSKLPPWMNPTAGGWLTAEYRMLPGSTSPRTSRSDRPDGRATEIQRLIGRSLRSVARLAEFGGRTLYLDCDVIRADGGTRTLSITGAFVAMVDALWSVRDEFPNCRIPVSDSVAAVSVGMVDGQPILDLCYTEDFAAAVDMNLVMTGSGRFVEIQGTGEESTFSSDDLAAFLSLGKKGIAELTRIQTEILGERFVF